MKKTQFIDGIERVHFIGGMVRMDMFQYKAVEGADPVKVPAGQWVMTPQGFISALEVMQQLADRLVDAGVLQRTNNK